MPIDVPHMSPCPFCEYLAGRVPCAFVSRGTEVTVFLNRAQYEHGALLVVPNVHMETVMDADPAILTQIFADAHQIGRKIVPILGAVGLNIFQNNGAVSGQTVPHLHVHVIPRYMDSDPAQRFREEPFPHTPFAELEKIAARLREAIDAK